jgi:cell surface protein SprA
LLDWTTLSASYNTRYNWLAASLLARELGNTLSNTQTRTINGELKFEDLYNKWRFLRAVYSTAPKQRNNQQQNTGNIPGANDKKEKNKKRNKADNKEANAEKKNNNNGDYILPGQQQIDTSKNATGKNSKKKKEKKVKEKKSKA